MLCCAAQEKKNGEHLLRGGSRRCFIKSSQALPPKSRAGSGLGKLCVLLPPCLAPGVSSTVQSERPSRGLTGARDAMVMTFFPWGYSGAGFCWSSVDGRRSALCVCSVYTWQIDKFQPYDYCSLLESRRISISTPDRFKKCQRLSSLQHTHVRITYSSPSVPQLLSREKEREVQDCPWRELKKSRCAR